MNRVCEIWFRIIIMIILCHNHGLADDAYTPIIVFFALLGEANNYLHYCIFVTKQ